MARKSNVNDADAVNRNRRKFFLGIDLNILLLGLTSFLTDISSEMIMPILPFFVCYRGMHALERVGKGLRTAPRDAIIADDAREEVRGKAFGLHRALDTSGAILGSTLALIFSWFIKLEFWVIIFLGALIAFSALIPLYAVKEKRAEAKKITLKIGLSALPSSLRLFIVIASLFALGNFTYMFFILRAEQFFVGRMAFAMPILLYVWSNVIYAFFHAIRDVVRQDW